MQSAATAAVTAGVITAPDVGAAPRVMARTAGAPPLVRERLLMDFGWRFSLGHASEPAKDFGYGKVPEMFAKAGERVADAAMLDFDDTTWRALDLPHDWAVELPFVPSPPPAPMQEDPRAYPGYKPVGRAHPDTSIGWYRRRFAVLASDRGRRISVEFDGVFRDAMVMVNGYYVAHNTSGYAPFRVDLSDFLNYGGDNVLTVRVDATNGEGWFYEGAGIYRHVWLVKSMPLHIVQWGCWARSEVKGDLAALTLSIDLHNEALTATRCAVRSTLFDPTGKAVATVTSPPTTVGALAQRTVVQRVSLSGPALWSPETPQLYRWVCQVVADGKTIDDDVVDFGIRTAVFDPDRGLLLNGKPVKIKGTCNHQDHAGVGMAIPDRLNVWRIEQLKTFGCNAYRASHNPPTPEVLDACDRLGLLVMDETRRMSSDEEAMSELSRLIRRDRNHPSVILWSIGNEEPQQGTERGARIALSMKALCRELDPTRPISAANNKFETWGKGITPVLDVMGCNYNIDKMKAFHVRYPKIPLLGSETASTVSTRGIYAKAPGYCVAYDREYPDWASTAEQWVSLFLSEPYFVGGFAWTGFDYHGEPTPYNAWPNVTSQFGILDLCGFAKDNFHYYKAWWGSEPVLHLFPHWNWRPGETVNVWCHSNLDRVELLVNGVSQGVRDVPRYGHVEWDVVFAPGVIEARGHRGGKLVLTDRRETADVAAKIVLSADRPACAADGEDVALVTAAVCDAAGRMVPTAGHLLHFAVSGPAALIGVGNGDPRCLEAEKADRHSAFNGLCQAILRVGKQYGEIEISASSPGLQAGSLRIAARPATARPAVK